MEIYLLGGDERMLYAGKALADAGHTVFADGFDIKKLPDRIRPVTLTGKIDGILFLGVPLTKDGVTLFAPNADRDILLSTIRDLVGNGTRIFCAGAKERLQILTDPLSITDLFTDEELLTANAELTAEALLGLLIREVPCAMKGAAIGVGGYGRIGKALVRLLSAVGAEPIVFARNRRVLEDLRQCGLSAFEPEAFSEPASRLVAFVNTVPVQIWDEARLGALPADCVLVEAASSPYGFDKYAADKRGLRLISAGGLPGRYSPKSAGEELAKALLRALEGGGYNE